MTDYDTLWRHNLETIRQLEEEYYTDDRDYDDYDYDEDDEEDYPYDTEEAYD